MSVLDKAKEVTDGNKEGARPDTYGSPYFNHTTTAELWTTYLVRRYGLPEGFKVTAEDVCMFNMLQKISRGVHTITFDTLVDIAGYAENINSIKKDSGEW